jgi:hypothetical protein
MVIAGGGTGNEARAAALQMRCRAKIQAQQAFPVQKWNQRKKLAGKPLAFFLREQRFAAIGANRKRGDGNGIAGNRIAHQAKYRGARRRSASTKK